MGSASAAGVAAAGRCQLRRAAPQRTMRAQARAMNSSLAVGLKDRRTALPARSSAQPIATSTWLGAALAAEQADPALTRTPAASNRFNSSLELTPGTQKFRVVGRLSANAALNTRPGKACSNAAA